MLYALSQESKGEGCKLYSLSRKIRPVILCGGQGIRLWPVSRASFPKQFVRLFSRKSLFQEAIALVTDKDLFLEPLIIGAQEYEHIMRSQLKEIGMHNPNLILEPEGKNTAAAIALACAASKPDELLLVLPSDHKITNKKQFHTDVKELSVQAARGEICLFGITPDTANTDYGYIEVGEGCGQNEHHFRVQSFREKPDQEMAEKLIESSSCYWNAGIFLFERSAMQHELERYAPKIKDLSEIAFHQGEKRSYCHYPHPSIFAGIPESSIDVAVMEKTQKALVGLARFDWLDIGCWKTYASGHQPDKNGNCVTGDVILEECSQNIIHAEGKLVTAIGLHDHTIIDTEDALLILPTDRVGQLASFVRKMQAKGIVEASENRKVRRPWGSYKGVHRGAHHQVKHIIVKQGEKLSFQYHHRRSEHWIIVKGNGIVSLGNKELRVTENESVYIPVGVTHRLHNPYSADLHIIEIQYGDYLGEDDIVRIEDLNGHALGGNVVHSQIHEYKSSH